jgi:hypothetical protein
MASRTHAERERHLNVMEKYLLQGKAVADVVAAAMESFRLCRSVAYEDVKVIRQRWQTRDGMDLAEQFGKALARREMLFRRAVQREDDELALRVEQDRCELLGLYPKKSMVVVYATATPAPAITDDELERIAGTGPVMLTPAPANAPDPNHFITSGNGG